MRQIDLTVEICGSSGDGTLAAGEILTTTLADLGYHVLSSDSYPAEIRGFGKCVTHIRVSDQPAYSAGRKVDVLVSLNDLFSREQLPSLSDRAVVLFDSWPLRELTEQDSVAGQLQPGQYLYGVPLNELSQRATHASRSRNLVALGALAGIMEIDVEGFVAGLKKKFRKKAEVAGQVEAAFRAGVEYARTNLLKVDPYTFALPKGQERHNLRVMTGNEAAAEGAIAAGLGFYAGYPITPATKIMEILSERLPAKGGNVVQTEDEIAAIGMVTGAAFAGVRAMTATSGPGLCLMTEFIGYNVMAENPVVIIDSQRGGPATGLPTKTEQSDLMMALFAGNGDAPRMVLAPTTIAECNYWVHEALYLAEKYQLPVIVLMDLFLSNAKATVVLAPLDPQKRAANRAPRLDELAHYRRQQITPDGISPRAIPGLAGGEHVIAGLEQDEDGGPVYDAETHTAMTHKRHLKLATALAHDVPAPERFGASGRVKVGVISFGSTYGAVLEAVERANAAGLPTAALKFIVLNPLRQEELDAFCADCDQILVPELNYSGQMASWLNMHVHRPLVRLDRVATRPFSYVDVLDEISRLHKEAK